jgi:valacyclovir hydrolase
MAFAELTTGARLHYEIVGHGAPLVALHGWLGTPRHDLPNVLDWLSERYTVYAPTRRGYGQSFPKPRDYPADFYRRDALDVLAFMDYMQIAQAHVIGYSDGGETALVAAGLQPQRFRSVAVWGAVGFFGPIMRTVIQKNYPAVWMTAEDRIRNGIADPNAYVLAYINAYKQMIDSGGDVSLSLAHHIQAPILMMLGDQDHLNPAEYAQKFLDRTPNGKLVMFPNVGHPIHDQDWAGFQRTLGTHLDASEKA